MSVDANRDRASASHSRPAPSPRTTNGAIAVANLDAQIDGARRLLERQAPTASRHAALADLLAMRGQFLGRIADYEEALALSVQAVESFPDAPESYLARAKARATFHRFTDALADLDLATAHGANGNQTQPIRAAILHALGRYDEAVEIRRHFAAARPIIRNIQPLAVLAGERGDLASAARVFASATKSYRDVSPFPVAWGEFQQGRMYMREEQPERARGWLAAAAQRLPQYAAAQGHLAEVEAALGDRQDAIRRLRGPAEQSDDPDYAAQLARILMDDGQTTAAKRWRDRAAARYDELLARFPEAFADHAIEFWLAAGNDPARALQLARMNVANRATPRAYQLLLAAALAAHDQATVCDAARRAHRFAHIPPDHAAMVVKANELCRTNS